MNNFTPQTFKNMIPALPEIPQIPTLKGGVDFGSSQFKDILGSMLDKVNNMMNKSEQLTEAAVTTGKVNLHEVMIAMAEEEIALGLTTQVAGKFISTVEKLTQMQV